MEYVENAKCALEEHLGCSLPQSLNREQAAILLAFPCYSFSGRDLALIDTILEGDCLELLPSLPEDSIDAIITDPPYELTSGNSKKGFMGKAWDGSGIAYDVGMWAECLRVLKPGGHMLAFGGDRTHHRMFCAIEDAGFEIRHTVVWTYGSGFPKSLDISKKLDQMAGAEREDLGPNPNAIGRTYDIRSGNLVQSPNKVIREDICRVTAPATPAAKQWAGFGSALKPAAEFICLARKPLAESTIAANVLRWGCGGLNIDGCRVGTRTENESGWSKTGSKASENRSMTGANYERAPKDEIGLGRFPANLIYSYPEDLYTLRDNVTPNQLRELAEWLDENKNSKL